MSINLQKIGDPTIEKPADFPIIHDANVDTLTTKINTIDTQLENISGVNIQNLQDRVTITETDINTSKSDINNLQTNTTSLSANQVNLQNSVTIAETDINILQTDTATLSANQVNLTNVNQDIIPSQTNTYSIGLSGQQWQNLFTSDVYLNNNKLSFVTDRLNIKGNNLAYQSEIGSLQSQVNNLMGISGTSALVIGEARDSTYGDGLFQYTSITPIGYAIDDLNEVMSIFVPPSPGELSSMSSNIGEEGKLSLGQSNNISTYFNVTGKDINEVFNSGINNELGIIDATTTLSGALADNQTSHAFAYPANSFKDGDKGSLNLYINDILVNVVDLTTFTSGTTAVNGNGFILSIAEGIKFESGQVLNQFKYRTGSWFTSIIDFRNGYNTVQVKHIINNIPFSTQKYAFFVDRINNNANFLLHEVNNLQTTGTIYLSGIKYNTGATAKLDFVIANVYDNTYSTSNITHPITTNCTISNTIIPPMVSETDIVSLSGVNAQTITISPVNGRLLNDGITLNTNVPKTLNRGVLSSTISSYNLLIDTNTTMISSPTNEDFNTEQFRITAEVQSSQNNMQQVIGYDSNGISPFDWNSQIKIVSPQPNYDNGLLQYNGRLYYPNNNDIPHNGDFTLISNGPSANRNYSLASGNREYLRYFYYGTSQGYTDFLINISCVNTMFQEVINGVSGNLLNIEILAPNQTQTVNGIIEFKDAWQTNFNLQFSEKGMFAETLFPTFIRNGNSLSWGVSLYQKNTINSGGVLILKITAGSNWTGYIENISITTL